MPSSTSRRKKASNKPSSAASPSLHSRVHSTSPTTVSFCRKLSAPCALFLSALPALECLLGFCLFCIFPSGEGRELVCVSQYLYKFTDDEKEKGTPYPLTSVTAKEVTEPSR